MRRTRPVERSRFARHSSAVTFAPEEISMDGDSATHVDVVGIARDAYRQGWSRAANVSMSTRESQAICKKWQRYLQDIDTARFDVEVRVSNSFRERIDVLDRATATAYELKVSGKNPTHEFFKDVFKVMEYNYSGGGGIQHLVFMTDAAGVRRLRGGLGRSILENSHDLGFDVALESIDE